MDEDKYNNAIILITKLMIKLSEFIIDLEMIINVSKKKFGKDSTTATYAESLLSKVKLMIREIISNPIKPIISSEFDDKVTEIENMAVILSDMEKDDEKKATRE